MPTSSDHSGYWMSLGRLKVLRTVLKAGVLLLFPVGLGLAASQDDDAFLGTGGDEFRIRGTGIFFQVDQSLESASSSGVRNPLGVCTFCECHGDMNTDGVVNAFDLVSVVACIGTPPVDACAEQDANCDGVIDEADVDVLLCGYGPGGVPGDCCPLFEACCLDDACEDLSPENCIVCGGVPAGPGSVCLAADFDFDCDVDAADLAILLGSFGLCPGCPADLDGDGDVDAADLALLLGSFGPV